MAERLVSITSDGLTLRGVLAFPSAASAHDDQNQGPFPGVVLCHPHPLYGGDMDNNVVIGMVAALTAKGFATLRFNFRSVGGSEGTYDQGIGERRDALAALSLLAAVKGVDASRLGLAGYSFGAGIALNAANAGGHVRAVAAVACPPGLIAPPGVRTIAMPRLLVAGERDAIASPEALRQLIDNLPRPVEVVAVPRADHFFVGQERVVGETVANFFGRWLKST